MSLHGPTRLEPVFEKRQRGWTTDLVTGEPKPKIITYIIGHGQQLARRRLSAILEANAVLWRARGHTR